jgi:spore maturation protein CgeB
MHILVVGGDKVSSIENYYSKYLKEFGVTVSRFLAPNLFYEYYETALFNKVLFKFGFSRIYESINSQFKSTVEEQRPDIIWIFKGMELFPETLEWAKAEKILLVNYNPDNPFLFTGRGSGNSNITNSLGLYDLHFTYNLEIERKIKSEFINSKTSYLPFGFELDSDTMNHCEALSEVEELCFLGNPDSMRSAFIKKLCDASVKVVVYGHDWGKFLKSNEHLTINDAVYGIEQWEVLRKYRIQLNLMRIHNVDSHNMRTFEIPGIGGIMLAPHTAEHELFFVNRKQVFLYKDLAACIALIKEILNFSTQQAQNVRTAAREKSVSAGYSYRDRAQQALIQLQTL